MAEPDLNAAQRAAVGTLTGPLLVLAGAGTGKTRVITYRIAALIRSGIRPERILAVTFTNKAAKEMRERATALLGRRKKGATSPEISTFHSLCVRVLRRHARLLGYPDHFVIYDRGDQESVARNALRDLRVGAEKLRPGDLLHKISGWKSRGLSPAEAEAEARNDVDLLSALAWARYDAGVRASGAMDFDDLLLNVDRLFTAHPEARFAEASRFDHLLIDEYQDTNGLQYRIVKALAERHGNLCVVGDDDQSIYSWRGAEVTHILGFHKDWPRARVIKLEENYRCRAPILKLANTLIAHNKSRHDKVLRSTREGGEAPRFTRFEDEATEAGAVVREIRARLDAPAERRVTPSDFAILFRTNEQPRAFETELRRERIPYVLVGGQSFFDRKEVKDLLCYLRLLANPLDEVSLLRVINTPPRGIGSGSVEALLRAAVAEGKSLWSALPGALAGGVVPEAVGGRVIAFRHLLDGLRARLATLTVPELVQEVVRATEYRREVERAYKTPSEVEARWASVEELVNAAAQYAAAAEHPSLLGFLEDVTLDGRDDKKDDPSDRQSHAVTLMTLHGAKGLEFPFVYLVGMEEGLLPHKRSILDGGRGIEEERRLCYVGVTRAREQLTLTLCRGRMKWGKVRPSLPSRFVLEMRGETERAARIAEAAAKEFAAGGAAPDATEGDAGPGAPVAATQAPTAGVSGPATGAPKRGAAPSRRTATRPAASTPRTSARTTRSPERAPSPATAPARSSAGGAPGVPPAPGGAPRPQRRGTTPEPPSGHPAARPARSAAARTLDERRRAAALRGRAR